MSPKSYCDIGTYPLCRHPWRNKGKRKLVRLGGVFLVYIVGMMLITVFRAVNSGDQGQFSDPNSGSLHHRVKRDIGDYSREEIQEGLLDNNGTRNCTPRSVHNFPPNFMSFDETRDGGVVVHIFIAIYMFAALAVVCDDYFVPSLEHICEDLGLQADVAGATFMAAGSSAPEFMTSVVGVFFAESDVGVGTIVGSAVFNILFIIGVCGVFAGMVVELTWYPLVRDTLFYLLSVLALFLVIRDQSVEWYEALMMVLLYAAYIAIMYFNRFLESNAKAWVSKMVSRLERQPLMNKSADEHSVPEEMQRARAHSRISNASMIMSRGDYEKSLHSDDLSTKEQETAILDSSLETTTPSTTSSKNGELMTVSEYESVWTIPEGKLMLALWIFLCPIKAVFFVTIPDSRRPGLWSRLYLVSFFLSVAWISGLTYLMVWMVTIAGDALEIPDTVMGLTLLAAGTSVPDCLSSVFVARDGYGDMAVSNSLGSNVFDILMCLGLPWLIECSIKAGGSVSITSSGLTYSSLTLLATVAFLLISMGVNRWKLNVSYGIFCLFTYLVVVALSCLYELNIFGDFNPPTCARDN
nr:putative sodium/potassium/calcium exchanger [Biomphalaria glabrata]